MGADDPGARLPGGAPVSRRPGPRPPRYVQPGPPREPVPVPPPQPRLLHERPAVRPTPPGGCPLSLSDPLRPLPPPLRRLPPPVHEQHHRGPGVQDVGGGGGGGACGAERRWRGAPLLAQRGRAELLAPLRGQEGLLTRGGARKRTGV